MFRIGRIKAIATAGLLALAMNVSPAAAANAGDLVGNWWGATDWDGTQYDNDGVTWTFNGNGSFSDNTGQTGRWNATSSGISFQYDNGARSQYTGDLVGDVVLGSMTNGEIRGQFMLVRGQR